MMSEIIDRSHESVIALLSNIDSVEEKMLGMEQAECPVRHHFGPGIYMREVSISAGVFAIGHHQKTEHLNIFLKGKVNVVKDDGTTDLLVAPMIFTSQPGRKVGLIIEDMVWLNVYSTEERDIEKLEDMFLDKSETFKSHESSKKLMTDMANNDDYEKMLIDLGVTEEIVREQSEFEGDQIPFPDVSLPVQIAASPIEGKGLFATCEISKGDIVAPARIGACRTPAGRYVNHSKFPNAKMSIYGDVIYLEATDNICGCSGGNLGEEILIDYRQSAKLIRSLSCQE